LGGFRIARLPETDDELYWLVQALWGVTIPRTRVCPDHVAPFTAFADAYFARNSLDPAAPMQSMALWHGSRGLSGKSMQMSVLGLTDATLLGTDVNLLGGSFAQSANVHEHIRNALDAENAPRDMIVTESATLLKFNNRAKIQPLTASQKTVRGPHPPRLLLDEIDEMEQAILDAALGQPMPQVNYLRQKIRPYTVMCSTWQNPEGTFTEMLRRAEAQGIPIYQWCYRESANPVDGWLDQETIDDKRRSIPAEMWRVEYELGEPSIGNRAFDSDAIEATFSLPFEPLATETGKDFERYTFAEPERHGTYVATADWGKEQDYTVIAVGRVDIEPHRLVYYLRVNRRPYPQMIGWFNEAIRRYHADAEHDATGLGNVVNDYVDTRALKFHMVGDKRAAMLSEYVSAVEHGKWRFPKIPSAYIEHKWARYPDLYSNAKAQGYHLPDTVCAFGLMHHMAQRVVPVVAPLVVARTSVPTRLQATFMPATQREAEVRVVSEAPTSSLRLTV